MKSTISAAVLILIATATAWSQEGFTASIKEAPAASGEAPIAKNKNQQAVRITGVRFTYPLVQKWIDDFNKEYPDVQVIIESRASSDPSQYDVLIEAYEHADEIKNDREYVYIGRYAILPVANSHSEFAKKYSDKGLNKDLIAQLFFHDIYADKENQKEVTDPFTIYTRLQKAGVPITFSNYFGYEQKDVKGKAIAGADEHLLKAVLRDSTGVSYLPLSLIYDRESKKVKNGITVLPVDLNGNDKVNDEEKFYDDLSVVTERLDNASPKQIKNVPIEYLHFSVDKKGVSAGAVTFLQWVVRNGEKDLHDFGYLKPEPQKLAKEKFEQFASKRLK
jgi:ABC-type phosphate transport system substrate-binding protein